MWELPGDMLEDFIVVRHTSIISASMEKINILKVDIHFQRKRRGTENARLAIITPAVSSRPTLS